MGLATPALKYILTCFLNYHFKGPLLTFGNQDIYTDAVTLQKWVKNLKLRLLTSANIKLSTSQGLQEINPESLQFVHAKTFFQLLGISQNNYYDVDKFNFDKPRILHDLEKPFNKKFNNFFNLLIDSGTLEHIFDTKAVMNNIVNVTKVGGYVLQIIPTNNFINHGFYQINPTYFYDFYTANGFKIVESYLIEVRPNGYRFHFYNQKSSSPLYVNPYSRLISFFLVKKLRSVKSISSPTQYAYQQQLSHSQKVKHPVFFDNITNNLRRILPFKYHPCFYIPWVIFKQLFSSKDFFDINNE